MIGAAATGAASIKWKQQKNRILSQKTWHANLVKSCNLIKIFNLQQNVLYLYLHLSHAFAHFHESQLSYFGAIFVHSVVCNRHWFQSRLSPRLFSLIHPRTKLCSKLALKRPAEHFILSQFPILCVSLYLHTLYFNFFPLRFDSNFIIHFLVCVCPCPMCQY